MKSQFLWFSIFITLLSCSKEEIDMVDHSYFTMETINNAWSAVHQGWIIDHEGNIFEFDNPTNWISTDSIGLIPALDIRKNIANSRRTDLTCSIRKITKLNSLVEGASKGSMSEFTHFGFDMGRTVFQCYKFDEDAQKHKKIVLHVSGNFISENTSEEAKQITKQLMKVNEELLKSTEK